MQDAVAALTSAIEEMRQARQALPEDLAVELEALIRSAEGVLESVRAKAED